MGEILMPQTNTSVSYTKKSQTLNTKNYNPHLKGI